MRAVTLIAIPLLGCSQPDLGDLEVASAAITDLEFQGLSILAGMHWAKGELEITDAVGTDYVYPIWVGGPSVGTSAGLTFGVEWTEPPPTQLYLPPGDRLSGNDLLGHYAAGVVGGALGVGGNYRVLLNGAGVQIKDTDMFVGVEVSASAEYMYLRARGDDYTPVELNTDVDTDLD